MRHNTAAGPINDGYGKRFGFAVSLRHVFPSDVGLTSEAPALQFFAFHILSLLPSLNPVSFRHLVKIE